MSILCSKGTTSEASSPNTILRGILFGNVLPKEDFTGIDLRVKQLNDLTENVEDDGLHEFGSANHVIIKPPSNDIPNAFAMPFRTGKIYNVHWKDGIDFEHLSVGPSSYWAPN